MDSLDDFLMGLNTFVWLKFSDISGILYPWRHSQYDIAEGL